MARVKRAVNSRKNHKKVLKLAKGYYGGTSRLFKTANETVIRALRKKSNLIFDVHLMLQDADKFIDEFAEAGSDIITVHQEAVPNLKETLKNIHSSGKKAGVSLKPGTPVDMILNVLDLTDVVLLMTVEPGFGGQSYLHQVDKKISELYKIINNQNLNIGIEVDGGITEENVNRPVRAGANIIVSGSAIFNSNNIKDTINKMRKKAEQGVQEREINNF